MIRFCPMHRATTSAFDQRRSLNPKRFQGSQFPVGYGGALYQSLFTPPAGKSQGCANAVSLQGGCKRLAFCIVVQLPERFLRLTQMLERSPLPG